MVYEYQEVQLVVATGKTRMDALNEVLKKKPGWRLWSLSEKGESDRNTMALIYVAILEKVEESPREVTPS